MLVCQESSFAALTRSQRHRRARCEADSDQSGYYDAKESFFNSITPTLQGIMHF